jgi:hypothetical protein
MGIKQRERPVRIDTERVETTRRNLLKVAGVSAVAFGGGLLPAACTTAPPEEMIDALCDTFIPGEASVPGSGPGAIEGGMRCYMADIMGQENLDMILEVMGLIAPDFPYQPYAARVATMVQFRDSPILPEMTDIFYGLQEATSFAFYSELMGQGPTPCGDPSFPGTFPLIGIPKFTEGAREDQLSTDP